MYGYIILGRLKMFVNKSFTFDFAHRLMYHRGKCRNLHGHTGTLILTFEGSPDEKIGMIMDFAILKKIWEQQLKPVLDHSVILNRKDEWYEELDKWSPVDLFKFNVLKLDGDPTCENIALWVKNRLQNNPKVEKLLPVGVRLAKITVYETATSWIEILLA